MAINDRAANEGHDRAAKPRSQLFTVRLWTEDVAGGSEYRGGVRAVLSGAFRGFRDWSDLVAFMIGQLEDDERAQMGGAEGDMRWPLEKR